MPKDLIRYSMQLVMLKRLLNLKLITEEEHNDIKKRLMKEYRIISDISS